MCGIAGAINYEKDAESISLNLNQSIIHRGPDDQSVYFDKNHNICLTMTRLSIIGLQSNFILICLTLIHL